MVRTVCGKQNINLTVDVNEVVEFNEDIAEALLRTKKFEKIKKKIKTRKEEGVFLDDQSKGL